MFALGLCQSFKFILDSSEIGQKAIKAEQFAFGALLPAAKVIEMETERRKELLRVEITVCVRRIPN